MDPEIHFTNAIISTPDNHEFQSYFDYEMDQRNYFGIETPVHQEFEKFVQPTKP